MKRTITLILILCIIAVYSLFFYLPTVHGAESTSATIVSADYYNGGYTAVTDTSAILYIDCTRYDMQDVPEDYFPAIGSTITLHSDNVVSYTGEYGYTECMFSYEANTITITGSNILWEESMGYIAYTYGSVLKYGYVECSAPMQESDLSGIFPVVSPHIRNGHIVDFTITTDTDVTCYVESTYTSVPMMIVVSYADGSVREYHGTSVDAMMYAVNPAVTDLYTYIPQSIYMPMVQN